MTKCLSLILFVVLVCSGTITGWSQSSTALSVLSGPLPNPSNGHVYYILSPSTWTAAQNMAVEMGGNLVTINNDEECDWLFDRFSFFESAPRPLWCGLNDRDHEGQFTWINGEPVTFLNWGEGEPNSTPELAASENYVFLFPSNHPGERRWRDANDYAADDLINDARWATADEGSFGCYGLVEVAPARPHAFQLNIRREAKRTFIEWPSLTSCHYQAQAANEIAGPWQNLGDAIPGNDRILTVADQTTQQSRFFRVLIVR